MVVTIKNHSTCRLVEFGVSADHRVKIKEGKNIDKSCDLARELKR